MGNRIYHIAALIIILFCACGKVEENCTNKGAYAQIERQVKPFTAISVADRIDAELVRDAAKKGSIELLGYGNLFSGIHSEVKEGTLYLSDHNRCKWLRELKTRIRVIIYVDDSLDFLYTLDDASFTTRDTLRFDFLQMDHRSTKDQTLHFDGIRFWIEHYEAGEVRIKGKTDIIKVTNFETGAFDGSELLSEDVFIYHYGLNKIHVNAKRTLECQIENVGDVLYYQKPINNPLKQGAGKGQLVPAF